LRVITKYQEPQVIVRNEVNDTRFESYLRAEVEDCISANYARRDMWEELLRQYKGVPKEPFSKDIIPVQNIEIPLGAIECESIMAQGFDLIFSVSPLAVVRGNKGFENHAKAVQKVIDHFAVDPYTNLRDSVQTMLMDDVQLGTGILYTIWQEDMHRVGDLSIVDRGPRVLCIDPDDLLVPGAADGDIQSQRVSGFRMYLTQGELELRGEQEGWAWQLAQSTDKVSPIKRRRDDIAMTTEVKPGEVRLYEIYELFVYFNYDRKEGQGDMDLLVTWDRTSGKILKLRYNPFDRRPFSLARYQLQPHTLYGMGVMEMVSPFQREVSDWHNFRFANARLANSRAYVVKNGSSIAGTRLKIMPNKPLYVDDSRDIVALQMADIFPSALMYEQDSRQMAEQRVGTITNFQGRTLPGHRTPAATMAGVLQTINRRFAPAFEEMKQAVADSLKQCFMRMQEQYKLGGEGQQFIKDWLTTLLGLTDAKLVMQVMEQSSRDIDDCITIEMTAASVSSNREANKQNGIQLMQVLGGYYKQIMDLAMVASNPQTPDPVKKLAISVAKGGTEAVDRLLREFDIVRDPTLFLPAEEDMQFGLAKQGGEQPGGQEQPPQTTDVAPGGDIGELDKRAGLGSPLQTSGANSSFTDILRAGVGGAGA